MIRIKYLKLYIIWGHSGKRKPPRGGAERFPCPLVQLYIPIIYYSVIHVTFKVYTFITIVLFFPADPRAFDKKL